MDFFAPRIWLSLSLGFAAFAAASSSAFAQGAPPPPAVTVAKPIARTIDKWDEYTGRFEAVQRVEVRARVSGFVDKIQFFDGQLVKAGDPLFVIDPRPYQLAVESAEADVGHYEALVAQAAADFTRAQALTTSVAITARDVDQRRANLDVARSQLQSAQVAVRNAKLNLEWTEVRAPIAGRISDRRVDVGNLIEGGQTGATLLTTIVTIDPIHFVFDASEADYLRYARLASQGSRRSSREAPNRVQVRLADEKDWDHSGVMNFVDNEIAGRSGTIRGRAVLENKDGFLTPGVFGRARLYGGNIDALLIPDEAIISDQSRKIVFTVDAGNKIVPKPVTLGPLALGLRVVSTGLTPNDVVVIGGLANPFVRPDAVVEPKSGDVKTVGD
jgi:multidrug efflux system membrane fusion protein